MRAEVINMLLGKNIRYLRKRAEMSQEQLADKLGYKSFTTIQKWESGASEPPIGIAQKIALLFQVDMDDLLKVDLETRPEGYYINPETAEIAQKIYEGKELRALFDAAVDADPEDLKTAYNVLLAMKRKERS